VKGLAVVPKTAKKNVTMSQETKYPWIVTISSDQSVKVLRREREREKRKRKREKS
jgi:hypothetical protein